MFKQSYAYRINTVQDLVEKMGALASSKQQLDHREIEAAKFVYKRE